MKTTHIIVTADNAEAAGIVAFRTIAKLAVVKVTDYAVNEAVRITATDFEVPVSGSANVIRKIRAALSEGDAE